MTADEGTGAAGQHIATEEGTGAAGQHIATEEGSGTAGQDMTPEKSGTAGRAIAPGEGRRIWFTNNLMTLKATSESTGGAYSLVEALAPAGAGPPLHVHSREDETFWVLEGTLTVWCGDKTFTVGPGSYVFLPRGIPHTFAIEGDGPARILGMATPGGFEGYFIAVGTPAESDGLPPAGPVDVGRLMSVGEEFGVEILGPPRQPLGRTDS